MPSRLRGLGDGFLPFRSSSSRSSLSRSFFSIRFLALFAGFVFTALFSARPGEAQESTPRVQVFGGYSYTRFDTRPLGFLGGTDLNGWNLSVGGNIFRNFGAVAELTGQYENHINFRDLAVGPQYLYRRKSMLFFAHVLFGKGRSFDSVGMGGGSTSMAYVGGGGMDLDFRRHFAFRVVQADYIHSALFGLTQKNFRISTGVEYRWGEIRQKRHPRREASH